MNRYFLFRFVPFRMWRYYFKDSGWCAIRRYPNGWLVRILGFAVIYSGAR